MERRKPEAERFETFDAEVKACFISNGICYSGYVLDSSEYGVAVFLSKKSQIPSVNQIGNLTLSSEQSEQLLLNDVRVVRKPWFVGNKRGFALILKERIQNEKVKEMLFGGTIKSQRIIKQRELALIESKSIDDDIRSYRNCIVKFFIVAQTASATLTSLYFGLRYHGYLNSTNEAIRIDLSFWRTMIAAIPGILAIGTSLLIAHKIYSIVRAESFLDIIKQKIILNDFPREYKGWGASLRKFKMVINSKLCRDCEYQMSCGELNDTEKKIIKERGLFIKPPPNLYFFVIFSILVMQTLFSILIVIYELLKYHWGKLSYLIAGWVFEFIFILIFFIMVKFLWDLRKGRYTHEKIRKTWLDLLEICPQRI